MLTASPQRHREHKGFLAVHRRCASNGSMFSSETSSFDKVARVIEIASGTPEIIWLEKISEASQDKYLLEPSEIFAKAFAQYITAKSGNSDLLAGIMSYRSSIYPLEANAQ